LCVCALVPLHTNKMKTVKFYTLGCKVNQYDTQNLRERFAEAGLRELENGKCADVCVINTCTVTHKADADSLNIIRKAKRQNPKAKIIVIGCLAELDRPRILDTRPSLIVPHKDKDDILGYLNVQTGPAGKTGPAGLAHKGISYFKGHVRAFLKIQDGCNNFCSYCKVPLVRGASRSRPLAEIVEEAKTLVKNGYKEIVVCGVCLGAYGGDLGPKINLSCVLKELEKIRDLIFIRLSSIELNDISSELIDRMAHSGKICPHLHIPLQSGDDAILKKMNRKYKAGYFKDRIKTIMRKIPLMAITTDVLVGFPGETEENFQNTLKLIKEILPLKVHIFPYSQREGTQAAIQFDQNVDISAIKERATQLRNLAEVCSRAYKKKFLNKAVDALIERRWKKNSDFWQGHTANYMEVLAKSNLDLKNRLINLRLKKIFKTYALGEY
jgi:threonylcarbamoyladenosine tRNA methylthiotransferase MtaB